MEAAGIAILTGGLLLGSFAPPALGACPLSGPADLWREAVCDIGDTPPDYERRAAGLLARPGMAQMPAAETVTGFMVLQQEGYLVNLPAGMTSEQAAAALDGLLAARGLQTLGTADRALVVVAANRALAFGGTSAEGAAPVFQTMVEARGHRLLFLPDDGFMVVSETVWCKWKNVRLAEGIALTEWYDLRAEPLLERLERLRDGPDRQCEEMILS